MKIKSVKTIVICLNVFVIVFTGCSKFPQKPIYEELSTAELEKAIKIDPDFAIFYDDIHSEALSVTMTPSQKALFKDVSYNRMYAYVKYCQDWHTLSIKDSIWKEEWKLKYAKELNQIDSIISYWEQYPKKCSYEMNDYVRAEIIDYANNAYKVKFISHIEKIDEIKFIMRWKNSEGKILFWDSYQQNLKSIKANTIITVKLNTYSCVPIDIIVTSISFNGKNVKSNYDYHDIPWDVRMYLKDPSEYHLYRLINEICGKDFVSQSDYIQSKRDEDLMNFDKLCYTFIEEIF